MKTNQILRHLELVRTMGCKNRQWWTRQVKFKLCRWIQRGKSWWKSKSSNYFTQGRTWEMVTCLSMKMIWKVADMVKTASLARKTSLEMNKMISRMMKLSIKERNSSTDDRDNAKQSRGSSIWMTMMRRMMMTRWTMMVSTNQMSATATKMAWRHRTQFKIWCL